MNDYKPNSHRFKEEQLKADTAQKKVEKVVSGTAQVKKKTAMNKVAENFISDILTDALIPTGKKAVSDIVKTIFDMARDGIDTMLFGERGRPRSDSPVKRAYSKFYDSRTAERSRFDEDFRAKPRIDFDEIVYESRGEAEMVLDEMKDRIREYGMVTVSDMYEMSGLSQPYTSNKYGWTNISTAEIERTRDGCVIKLPKIKSLD